MKFSNWLTSLRAPGQRIRKSGRRGAGQRQRFQGMESLEPRVLLTFQGVAGPFFTPFSPSSVDLADLDGDGDLDAFVAAESNSLEDGSEKVWFNDGNGGFTDSGQRLARLDYPEQHPCDLAWSGDGNLLASTSAGDKFLIWDLKAL